jgi:serine/threonine protein kinase
VFRNMTVGGRYRLQRVLGRGGLGEVWEALDETLGRRVAIKFVTGVVGYPEVKKRFAREARTLASLHHNSVVTVHDAGTVDHNGHSLPYLVMERLDGDTWEKAQVGSVVETGARLADALGHVHQAKVVHRDVKPANIMICTDGRVVLMDFGIARSDRTLTGTANTTGMALGTPGYMAPEQLEGQAAPASDIYSLGLVLFEKLTGRRLAPTQTLPQARAAIPEHLLALLTRMTSPIPDERPSAAECAQELRAAAEHMTPARRVLSKKLPKRWGGLLRRRRPVPVTRPLDHRRPSRTAMDRDEVLDSLYTACVDVLTADRSTLDEQTRFADFPGVDSLDLVEVLMTVEIHLGLSLDEELFDGVKTIGQAADRIIDVGSPS